MGDMRAVEKLLNDQALEIQNLTTYIRWLVKAGDETCSQRDDCLQRWYGTVRGIERKMRRDGKRWDAIEEEVGDGEK